ncbi:hypothetical protein K491DRAFT_709509 [Lophiostoma macrostomum CBS 122681]|uniref:Uncharacterized protein n=1 Tax=Lophiostoma macrostomum CBS 122681 TaxID=1314788 RepID=A0A6A6TS02_9PLEO|nr:hypothetical protein K491DRAFT_709509 [Lophiostoma macrostomum CBS 122681]
MPGNFVALPRPGLASASAGLLPVVPIPGNDPQAQSEHKSCARKSSSGDVAASTRKTSPESQDAIGVEKEREASSPEMPRLSLRSVLNKAKHTISRSDKGRVAGAEGVNKVNKEETKHVANQGNIKK